MNKFKVFIQARMGSTRLSGKVLREFENGETILSILIAQILKSSFLEREDLVILTSTSREDNRILEYAENNEIKSMAGDEQNVLKRFYDASKVYESAKFFRICADNPFIQPELIDIIIQVQNNFDYISFCTSSGIPVVRTHYGIFPELISNKALKRTHKIVTQKYDKENVTSYIYNHPEKFSLKLIPMDKSIENTKIRLTVDDQIDFDNIQFLLKNLNGNYSFSNIMKVLAEDKYVMQKMSENIKKYEK